MRLIMTEYLDNEVLYGGVVNGRILLLLNNKQY